MAAFFYKWFFALAISQLAGSDAKNITLNISEVAAVHPFYLSVTEINHNASAKTLEISCKMFADDFEAIIEKNYKTTLDITTEKDKVHFDRYIPDYIIKRLFISVDGKPVKLNYIGFENERESAYVYLEVVNVPDLKKIEINNSILYDFVSEQINILHVTLNGNRKSIKLVNPSSKVSFNF